MSPERAASPREDNVSTPKLSVPGSPIAGTPAREAQSAFSFLLEVAQSQSMKSADDDLTSLTWLQNKDLLKGMNFVSPAQSNRHQQNGGGSNGNQNIFLQDQSPTSDYIDDSSISAAESSSSSLNSPIPQSSPPVQSQRSTNYAKSQQRYRHPHTIPYDPMVHVQNKPPYSFSCLIFMAIEDSYTKALPVKDIYAWILEHFPYFRTAPTGWKNSVRHNLSLNKCFQKVEKAPNLGKGSLWKVDQQYRPNLLQALTRSPFHPCSTLDSSNYYLKTCLKSNNNNNNNNSNSSNNNNDNVPRIPNPDLFPFLSTEMSKMVKSEPLSDSESLDAADAAAVMLSLRDGSSNGSQKNMVITNSPSEDHTYSAADNPSGSNDEAFESEDERVSTLRVKINFEDEEDRKIKEGAETLLNLAGINTKKRHSVSDDNARNKMHVEFGPAKRKLKPRFVRNSKSSKYANANNHSSVGNNNEEVLIKRIKTEFESFETS